MGRRSRDKRRQERGAELAPLSTSVPEGIVVEQPLQAQPVRRPPQAGPVVQFQHYEGPLPHPSTLRGFEEVVPGSADRIITQFEEQGRHRRKQENRVISHNLLSSTLGQIFAFVLFMTIAVGGGYLIQEGKDIAGGSAIVASLVSAAYVLRSARKAKQKDLDDKKNAGKAVARR